MINKNFIDEKNELIIRNISKIHANRFEDEKYSDYLHQFKCESSKEINVDANAKETHYDISNDDNLEDRSYYNKRKRSPVMFTKKEIK